MAIAGSSIKGNNSSSSAASKGSSGVAVTGKSALPAAAPAPARPTSGPGAPGYLTTVQYSSLMGFQKKLQSILASTAEARARTAQARLEMQQKKKLISLLSGAEDELGLKSEDELSELLVSMRESLKAAEAEKDRRNKCAECCSKKPAILFMPCRHMRFCEDCGSELKICPMCDKPITKRVQPFLA